MASPPITTLKDASVKIAQLEDTVDIYKKKLTEVVVTNVMESIEKDVQYSLLKREMADVQKESIAKTEKCNDLTNMLHRARNLGAVHNETTPTFVLGKPKKKKRVHSEDDDSIATSDLFPISTKRIRSDTTCSTYPVTRTVSSTLSSVPRHVSVSQCTANSNEVTKTVSDCGSAAPSDSATSQHTEDSNEDEGSDAGSDAGSESGSGVGSETGSEAGSEAGSSEAGSSEAGSQQSSAAPSESATSSLSDYDQCKCKDCVAKVTTSKNRKTATKC